MFIVIVHLILSDFQYAPGDTIPRSEKHNV
jgi:hypothetical protein